MTAEYKFQWCEPSDPGSWDVAHPEGLDATSYNLYVGQSHRFVGNFKTKANAVEAANAYANGDIKRLLELVGEK